MSLVSTNTKKSFLIKNKLRQYLNNALLKWDQLQNGEVGILSF